MGPFLCRAQPAYVHFFLVSLLPPISIVPYAHFSISALPHTFIHLPHSPIDPYVQCMFSLKLMIKNICGDWSSASKTSSVYIVKGSFVTQAVRTQFQITKPGVENHSKYLVAIPRLRPDNVFARTKSFIFGGKYRYM